jgi:hypothetical protein
MPLFWLETVLPPGGIACAGADHDRDPHRPDLVVLMNLVGSLSRAPASRASPGAGHWWLPTSAVFLHRIWTS